MSGFQPGDRVVASTAVGRRQLKGVEGVVVNDHNEHIGVIFDKDIEGHNLNPDNLFTGEGMRGWFVYPEYLTLIPSSLENE